MNAPKELDAAPRSAGRIIIFYSYKGGTGRSMALANVAWILASNRRRVLVIDWDLEAPGLHRYFRPFLPDEELAETPGLIDFFVHFIEAARIQASKPTDPSASDRPWFYDRADLLRYSVPLEYEFPDGGVLDFVAAGQQGPSYAARVNSFLWGEFYEKLGGGVFLEAMKAQLREQYDYVLIDSRTGLSDTSGICTVQMPDELVACFTLNLQSIFGAVATAESAGAQRRLSTGEPGLRIWPVPTRIDFSEKERLEGALLLARQKFAPFLWHVPYARRLEYWGGIQVLYFPYYAYEEVLATIADQPRQTASLLDSMERLTRHITAGEITTMPKFGSGVREQLLTRYSPAVQAASSKVERRRFYISYAKADESMPIVRKLGAALDRRFGAHAAFWDERVPLGEKWEEVLNKALGEADAVIVAAGPNWKDSGGSRREVGIAIELGKPVIPLLVQDAAWQDLPPELIQRRGTRMGGNLEMDLERFVEQLAESLPPPPTTPAAIQVDIDDPQRGQWGGKSVCASRRLTAHVTEGRNGWFNVRLAVEAIDNAPLEGDVEFHLHPTFRPSVVRVRALNGQAVLEHSAWGAFTVGASTDDGLTRLELNLAELSDAPTVFRER